MVNDATSSIIQGDGSYIETGNGPSHDDLKDTKNGATQYSFHGKKSLESVRLSKEASIQREDSTMVKMQRQSVETRNEEIEERDIIHDQIKMAIGKDDYSKEPKSSLPRDADKSRA